VHSVPCPGSALRSARLHNLGYSCFAALLMQRLVWLNTICPVVTNCLFAFGSGKYPGNAENPCDAVAAHPNANVAALATAQDLEFYVELFKFQRVGEDNGVMSRM